MRMHIITNFEASAGAETMLARLLRVSTGEPPVVVSLIGVSERNRSLAGRTDITFVSLGVRGPVSLLRAVPRLASLIRRHRPTEILCWMYHAMVLGSVAAWMTRMDVPVFWTVRQALDDPSALTRSTRMAVSLARRLSRSAAGIIYNSERAMGQHAELGFSAKNSTVIPNGFELPEPEDRQMDVPRVFGIAARFHPQKDFPTFFHAAATLARTKPSARFVAAGQGATDSNEDLLKMMADAGLERGRIELRGQVRDMSQFYRDIDVLVLSSRTEGFPNVVAEAMSHGRPVVSTDVGDAGAIVGETGTVVRAGDAVALAAAMDGMAALSARQYADLAQRARRRIDEFYGLASVASRYDAFLGQAA